MLRILGPRLMQEGRGLTFLHVREQQVGLPQPEGPRLQLEVARSASRRDCRRRLLYRVRGRGDERERHVRAVGQLRGVGQQYSRVA